MYRRLVFETGAELHYPPPTINLMELEIRMIWSPCIKAGRLVGLADCYAVTVLADNATFLLAVNRIAPFR